jgi:O-glycosyl hydrolase
MRRGLTSSALPPRRAAFVWVTAGLLAGCAAPIPVKLPPPPAPAAAPAPAATPTPAKAVTLRITETSAQQVIEGFGATVTEGFDPATGADDMGALRPRVIDAVFTQVGITMGHLDVSPYEGFDPSSRRTANDDGDAEHFNWAAFNFVRSEGHKRGIVDLALPLGFDNFMIHGGTNVRWADPWLGEIRRRDYPRYLREMTENVLAPLVHWRERYGVVPRWHHLFNEPISGNGELGGATHAELVDLVKAVGARLRREGFGSTMLVVPSEETEETSLAAARAILADAQARAYVGAIAFHTYPYGSVYSDVNRILETSGAGRPDAQRLAVRRELRELARNHGLQLWMTEVSNGRANTMDSMRGRAIHIHDELRHAGVSSYWGMFAAWDALATRGTCDDDCLVHFNRARGSVSIAGMGRAMGHYARWVRRGARWVDSETDDPLVLASAFRDAARRTLVTVIVNNHREPVRVALQTACRGCTGALRGEQSSAQGYWLPLQGAERLEDGHWSVALPARSVTSVSMELP